MRRSRAAGSSPTWASVVPEHPRSHAEHAFVPTITTNDSGDRFLFSQDTLIYTDNQFRIDARRDANDISAGGNVAVSGYLIDCSVAACN